MPISFSEVMSSKGANLHIQVISSRVTSGTNWVLASFGVCGAAGVSSSIDIRLPHADAVELANMLRAAVEAATTPKEAA